MKTPLFKVKDLVRRTFEFREPTLGEMLDHGDFSDPAGPSVTVEDEGVRLTISYGPIDPPPLAKRLKHLAFIALAVFGAAIPAPASGQVADAILTYQAQERDAWIGGLVEWVIPTAGHAYAGDVKRGLVPAAVSFGGLAAALWGLGLGDNPVGVDAPRVMFESEGSAVVTALGALAWVGGRVWGTVSAVQAVGDANAALLDRLGVSEDRIDLGTLVTPTGQMGLQFRISIP